MLAQQNPIRVACQPFNIIMLKCNLFTGIADPNAETGDGTETSFVMQVEGVSDTITADASNEDVS